MMESQGETVVRRRQIQNQDHAGSHIEIDMNDDFRSEDPTPFTPHIAIQCFLVSKDLEMIDISTCTRSKFDNVWISGAPVLIINPGFLNNGKSPFPQGSARVLREVEDRVNILIVDWGKFAGWASLYFFAVQELTKVGAYVGEIIESLVSKYHVRPEDITFVGHSLGAHLCHFVAKSLPRIKLGKIFALDPAAPLFTWLKRSEILDMQDADFVCVLHTCGKFFGIMQSIGHADFFVNGGKQQPGLGLIRSHSMAWAIFIDSIANTSKYKAFRGSNYVHFGLDLPTTVRGDYFIHTELPDTTMFVRETLMEKLFNFIV